MASDASSSITRTIIDNILEWASELQQTARDFSQLGAREQARVWNNLSGDEGRRRTFGAEGKEYFSEDVFEPDDVVRDASKDLSEELDKLSRKKKAALEKALELSPQYVQSQKFRMKFLRAEQFDARMAAARMALHFEAKLELFGEEKLGRDIILSDLSEDDMACLKSGYLQIPNDVDFGYRKIIFYYKALSDCYETRENLMRAFWYVTNKISDCEDVQKLGVVNVVYNLGGFPKNGMDYEKSRRLAGLFKAIPVRFCSFYPCIDTRAWAVVVDTFSVIVSRYLRVRLRVIKGNHEEVLLKLKAVGIPSDALPVNDKSELLVNDHLAWIAERQKEEEDENEPPPKRSRSVRDFNTGDIFRVIG